MDKQLKAGDKNYKAYVGPPDRYDFMGATQFRLLTTLGLRSQHKLLDFGCGSLRSGKLFIPYLDKANYFGQDPNQWLIDEGIKNELGESIINIKKPNFSNLNNFEIGFKEKFDFVVAQSIFSHTSLKLTKKGLLAIYNALSDDGLAVVTIIEGDDYIGEEEWVYPECTTFQPSTIKNIMNQIGCNWRRLYWFHPKQTWFILSKKKSRLPSFLDTFFLLGGEEAGSTQYKRQKFLSNRLFSIKKMIKSIKKK
tara:strand:- start:1204 stop:1956 length:753 start_codon:yes stop_codon:yes gene_type:complete